MTAGDEHAGQEFPPELDEFLAYCVSERGEDWQTISQDFMEVASDVGESCETAEECFSVAALRARWVWLQASDVRRVEEERTVFSTPADCAEASPPAGSELGVVPSGFSIFKDSLKEQIDRNFAEVQRNLPSATADQHESDAESSTSADAEQTSGLLTGHSRDVRRDAGARRFEEIFGTSDLQTLLPAGERKVSGEVPSFDAVLLSHGVNPEDIEGPLVELPSHLEGIFSQLRRGLEDGRQYGQNEQASLSTAVPSSARRHIPEVARGVACEQKSEAGAVRDESENVELDGGSVTCPEESDSGDSLNEDFRQRRLSMKNSSIAILKDPPSQAQAASHAATLLARRRFVPPVRQRLSPKKFMKLDISSEDDIEGGDGDTAENENTDEDVEDEDGLDLVPKNVMKMLLRRAPHGDCAWEVWLDLAHRWPKLQIVLGSPDFIVVDGNMKVSFNVNRLREALEEEKLSLLEARRKKAELADRMKNGAEAFIKEAEYRRSLLGSRLGGGFVLSSQFDDAEVPSPARRRQEAEPLEEEESERSHVKEKTADIPSEKAREQRHKRERQCREEVRQREEREAREATGTRRQIDATTDNESCLEELRNEVARHRIPLYDPHISHGPNLEGVSPWASMVARGEEVAAFGVPWGVGSSMTPTTEQREAVDVLCARGVEALLLLSADTLKPVSGADCLKDYTAVVIVLLRTPFDVLLGGVSSHRQDLGCRLDRSLASAAVGRDSSTAVGSVGRGSAPFHNGRLSTRCARSGGRVRCTAFNNDRRCVGDDPPRTLRGGTLCHRYAGGLSERGGHQGSSLCGGEGCLGPWASSVASCSPWAWSVAYLACLGGPD